MDKEKLQEDLNKIAETKVENGKPIPKVLIGIPILAWTHEFATSFLRFWTELMLYQEKGRHFQVCYEFRYRRPVHIAEEELAQMAIDAECTHLLLMDDDVYDVTVQDFLALLDADKDVVGGIMHANGFPFAMCAFRRYDPTKKVAEQPILAESTRLYEVPPEQRTGIQPVDLIPFAFTMIKTEVFKKLKKPWFTCNTQAPTDSWFADAILDANLEYFAHFGVLVNHNGITPQNVNLKRQIAFQEAQMKKGQMVIELSPEQMATHEAMVQQKMKEAEIKFKQNQQSRVKLFSNNSGMVEQVSGDKGHGIDWKPSLEEKANA